MHDTHDVRKSLEMHNKEIQFEVQRFLKDLLKHLEREYPTEVPEPW